jgi:hypothetical protein
MRTDRPTPKDKYRALHGVDAAPTEDAGAAAITHVGGGVFELPNGERVRGREDAEARMAELAKEPAPTE